MARRQVPRNISEVTVISGIDGDGIYEVQLSPLEEAATSDRSQAMAFKRQGSSFSTISYTTSPSSRHADEDELFHLDPFAEFDDDHSRLMHQTNPYFESGRKQTQNPRGVGATREEQTLTQSLHSTNRRKKASKASPELSQSSRTKGRRTLSRQEDPMHSHSSSHSSQQAPRGRATYPRRHSLHHHLKVNTGYDNNGGEAVEERTVSSSTRQRRRQEPRRQALVQRHRKAESKSGRDLSTSRHRDPAGQKDDHGLNIERRKAQGSRRSRGEHRSPPGDEVGKRKTRHASRSLARVRQGRSRSCDRRRRPEKQPSPMQRQGSPNPSLQFNETGVSHKMERRSSLGSMPYTTTTSHKMERRSSLGFMPYTAATSHKMERRSSLGSLPYTTAASHKMERRGSLGSPSYTTSGSYKMERRDAPGSLPSTAVSRRKERRGSLGSMPSTATGSHKMGPLGSLGSMPCMTTGSHKMERRESLGSQSCSSKTMPALAKPLKPARNYHMLPIVPDLSR